MRFELMYHGAMPRDPDEMYPCDQSLFYALAPVLRAKEMRALWGGK